jgi:hypothetical protein
MYTSSTVNHCDRSGEIHHDQNDKKERKKESSSHTDAGSSRHLRKASANHGRRSQGNRRSTFRWIDCARNLGQSFKQKELIFFAVLFWCFSAQAVIMKVPLQLDRKEPYQFKILPRTVTSFVFPDEVNTIFLGDTQKFNATKIDDFTVVMKATTTEVGLFTGIQIQLANQQLISIRIITTDSPDSVDSVQFYRGKSPFEQDLAKERKQLQTDFEKFKQEFLTTHAKGSQAVILKEMQSHFYAKNKLGISRKDKDIELTAVRYLEIGENGYLYFDVTNFKKEEIDPRFTTLTSVKKSGVGFVDLKDLRDAIYCDNPKIKTNQKAQCSIAFSLKDFSRKDEKLKLYYQVSEDVTDLFILGL